MNLPASDYRCYRHPDREAYISCQRCERLICPECMNDASVGFQCPSCVSEGSRSTRPASMNYSMREYANDVVYTLSSVCRNHELPMPHIISV